jgi:hypothetical protein
VQRRLFIGGSDAIIASGARNAERPNRKTSQTTSSSSSASQRKPSIGNGTSATPAGL